MDLQGGLGHSRIDDDIREVKDPMNPKINDVVLLVDPNPESSVGAGAVGTVVAVFTEPEQAYEVEFCDENGASIAQLVLRAPQFLLIK